MRTSTNRTPTRRRGYGLLELALAAMLLAVALVLVAQTAAVTATQRRAVEYRRLAMQEAANLMERLADRPWTESTPEAARETAKAFAAKSSLPRAEFTVDVETKPSDPSAKKIAVAIRWGAPDRRESPVRLVGWVYRREGAKP